MKKFQFLIGTVTTEISEVDKESYSIMADKIKGASQDYKHALKTSSDSIIQKVGVVEADEIRNFKSLLDEGVSIPEEFAVKKKQIWEI